MTDTTTAAASAADAIDTLPSAAHVDAQARLIQSALVCTEDAAVVIPEAERTAKRKRLERQASHFVHGGRDGGEGLSVQSCLPRSVIDELQAEAYRDGHDSATLTSFMSKDVIVAAYKQLLPDLPLVAAITVIAGPQPHHYDVHAVRMADVEAAGGVDKLHDQCVLALGEQEPGYFAGLLAKSVAHRRTRGAGTAEQLAAFPCDLKHFDFGVVCTTFAY